MHRSDCSQPAPDPMIDEIRAIRRELADQFNNDVGKLCDYFRQVGDEYRTGTGRFRREGSSTTHNSSQASERGEGA